MRIKNNLNKQGRFGGFIAVTAVMMIACVTILFASVIMRIVVDYSDMVTRHEWRIQANLNAESCLNAVTLMVAKDYFLNGEVFLQEFGCSATILQDYAQGKVFVSAKAVFNTVNSGEYDKDFSRQ